ncbi:protein FAR1-RELATED SEQUENCE 5-like [Camellia sinensis]|uniref:protein FAR1-RELATED SEQUENCE 5-like n=1 Tax=Camellia sinensis TaxID=4442 RepID=UPI001036EEE3|nr:protein FAR1-RELATED SEQUENCE 5-like [Camellia sinensis]
MANAQCGKDDTQFGPILGMKFDSEQFAYDFYDSYGGRIGFSIRREYAHKSKTGEITSRAFACSKEGHRKADKKYYIVNNARAETRIGCGASMNIKLNRKTGKYTATNFVEMHNHSVVVNECAHMLHSQRKIFTSQSIEIDLATDFGIPLRSSYELMSREAGGGECVRFFKQDQKNYLKNKKIENVGIQRIREHIKILSRSDSRKSFILLCRAVG